MADEIKTGEKMDESEVDASKSGTGEKVSPDAEVQGRQGYKYRYCWHPYCHACNVIPMYWTSFRCWACGRFNKCY